MLIEGKRVVESRGRGRIGGGRAAAAAAALVGAAPLEPKWAAVAAYCRRHGVDRGPVQCRKRWSNLAGDYKKIKEWERGKGRGGGGAESFWAMRNDVRREQRLPGFFDREVYDILDGSAVVEVAAEEGREKGEGSRRPEVAAPPLPPPASEEEVAVFDSGRTAAEDGLFSDFDDEKEAAAEEDDEEDEERTPPVTPPVSAEVTVAVMSPVMPQASAAARPLEGAEVTVAMMTPVMPQASAAVRPMEAAEVTAAVTTMTPVRPAAATPVPGSEKRSEQMQQEPSNHPGMAKDKHTADTPAKDSPSEKGSPSGEGHKRRRTSEEEAGDATLQSQLIEVAKCWQAISKLRMLSTN